MMPRPWPGLAQRQAIAADFYGVVTDVARDIAQRHPDPDVRRAAIEDPIYIRPEPTARERAAIGPPLRPSDVVLGIHHGRADVALDRHFITLYETGISQGARRDAIAMATQVRQTLLHELDHHLGRNHTLASVLVAATILSPQGG